MQNVLVSPSLLNRCLLPHSEFYFKLDDVVCDPLLLNLKMGSGCTVTETSGAPGECPPGVRVSGMRVGKKTRRVWAEALAGPRILKKKIPSVPLLPGNLRGLIRHMDVLSIPYTLTSVSRILPLFGKTGQKLNFYTEENCVQNRLSD